MTVERDLLAEDSEIETIDTPEEVSRLRAIAQRFAPIRANRHQPVLPGAPQDDFGFAGAAVLIGTLWISAMLGLLSLIVPASGP